MIRIEADLKLPCRSLLDGATEPRALEGNMLGMFDGTGLIPHPFAHPSLRSAVSFFPDPLREKLQGDDGPNAVLFQFTFREYDAGTPVKTFAMKDFKAAEGLIEETGQTLLNPTACGGDESLRLSAKLSNKEEGVHWTCQAKARLRCGNFL